MLPGRERSRVVTVTESALWTSGGAHPALVREVLSSALARVFDVESSADAWRRALRDDDVVGVKFNQSGQRELGTTPELGAAIVESMIEAGWSASRIVLIEAPQGLARRYGTRPVREGFRRRPTRFGSGADELARVLDQVTGIVNVPFLKTHNLCGMTCCLKNLSHALVKHPARYHGNGCSPHVADIASLPDIALKLRLNIVDAIRIVHDSGPLVDQGKVSAVGSLMASTDPVAADAVGLLMLNAARLRHGLSTVAGAPSSIAYLAAAHRKGLGMVVPHGIDHREFEL